MKISTDVQEPTDDLYDVDDDMWIAKKVAELGFPIAGTVQDLYEDAVICIPPMFKFDWKPNRVKIGRVIHIERDLGYQVMSFVLLMEDGTQVPCSYGISYDCFFALPEDSEGFAMPPKEEGRSPYARKFDELNHLWVPNDEMNFAFLRAVQSHVNIKLERNGFVMLNDVYTDLGFERTSAGMIVGWIYEEGKTIDFGLEDFTPPWLDFNVDGNVFDKLP